MALLYIERDQWTKRCERAVELRRRWPFAAEVLDFYGALLDVQRAGFGQAQREAPPAGARAVAAFAVAKLLPSVVEVSVTKGPPALAGSVIERFHEGNFADVIERWLRGDELPLVDRFLARASAGPVLEALGSAAGAACEGPRDERHCPVCGGLPQVSYFATSSEALQSAHRYLECSRCATSWAYPRLACAACGESEGARLSVLSEIGTAQAEVSGEMIKSGTARSNLDPSVTFPHLRIDGCKTCKHFILTVNLERDAKAVPLVDELAAIPLTLYANEHGLNKAVPNLMGL